MRTFIRRSGNKSKLVKKILPLIPDYNGTYIEPFVGTGAVFLNLEPQKWIINDINKELKPLKLLDANFKVEFLVKEEENWNRNGSEKVRFLVRLNRGTKEAEIHKISSGGELSRLMLAINLVLAKSISPKTLVFDEVDSGVSGAVADSVGSRLSELSRMQQVLVVTHLPQVASRGNNHYRSFKFNNETETFRFDIGTTF